MLRALQSLGVEYLVRVKATARFTTRSGISQLLKHWAQRGHVLRVRGSLFDRDHACTGTICLLWEEGQDEAWCLFSNSPRAIGHYYALRWWQEESFRDLKSAGWHWPSSHLRCPLRMERLLLVMAIAYALTLSSGVQVWSQPPRVRNLTATSDELLRLSLFSLGLRYLRRVLADVAPLNPFLLCFPPPAFFRRI